MKKMGKGNIKPVLVNCLMWSRGVNIGKYPSPGGGGISADVIWGGKYEKAKRKRGKHKRKRKKGEIKWMKGERKWMKGERI
jgi:hypothetical protein